jgi:hypothetical protein
MKKLFFTISLLFTSLLFSQQIKIEDNKFYVNDSLVYKHDVKKILMANQEAFNMYNNAKSRQSWGGILLATGIGLCVADAAMGLTTENKTYPTAISLAGLVVAGIAIPILRGNRERVAKSIDLYNETSPKEKNKLGYNYDMKIITNQNGVGVNIRF